MTQRAIFRFFEIKFNFSRIVCYEVSLCENFQRQIVEQPISYKVTEKHWTESGSFHLKYWLKLLHDARCTLSAHSWCLIVYVSALPNSWYTGADQIRICPNDVMCKIRCRQLHNELFGRRQSTLQSHDPFTRRAERNLISMPQTRAHT